MKGKYLVIAFHDASPACFFEMKKFFSMLNNLGIKKKSILVTPNWHKENDISKDKKFIKFIKEEIEYGSEIVLHGFYHESQMDLRSRFFYFIKEGVDEFRKIDKKTAKLLIIKGILILNKVFNFKPHGFIAPNWAMSKDVKKIIHNLNLYYTTRSSVVFKDKKVNSLVYGFSAGNNPLLKFIVKYFSFLRLKFYSPRIIRFEIHPDEIGLIDFEKNLIKEVLKKGYKPITFSELRKL